MLIEFLSVFYSLKSISLDKLCCCHFTFQLAVNQKFYLRGFIQPPLFLSDFHRDYIFSSKAFIVDINALSHRGGIASFSDAILCTVGLDGWRVAG